MLCWCYSGWAQSGDQQGSHCSCRNAVHSQCCRSIRWLATYGTWWTTISPFCSLFGFNVLPCIHSTICYTPSVPKLLSTEHTKFRGRIGQNFWDRGSRNYRKILWRMWRREEMEAQKCEAVVSRWLLNTYCPNDIGSLLKYLHLEVYCAGILFLSYNAFWCLTL